MDYLKNDLTSLHEKLVNKELTATQLAKATFETIKKRDQKIDAFLAMNEEAVMKQAEKIDQRGIDANNILDGIPVGIKDNMVTKDLRTTAASKMLANFDPIFTATAVEKLEKAGMLVAGKLNLDEFAMGSSTETSAFKKTKNAWDQTKVPGGSSGGPAAAVASGEIIAALASDTGGSIRQPAAFNGVVGLKPTYGRVSRYGLIAFASSLDQIGPITRTVKDNALILNAIAGQDSHDSTTSPREVPDFTAKIGKDIKGMRIGVPKEFMNVDMQPAVREAVENAIKTFKDLGAEVEEVSLPNALHGIQVYYIVATSEASSNLQRFDGIRYGFRANDVKSLEDVYVRTRSEGFGDEVKRRIMLGTFSLSAGLYDEFFGKATKVRTLICEDFDNIFKDYDLILGPTTTSVAFGFNEKTDDPIAMYMNDVLTIPANLAGLPAMSIPGGFSKDGLPVGIHLIGPRFAEATLYQAGDAFEKATDYHKQTPTIGGQN